MGLQIEALRGCGSGEQARGRYRCRPHRAGAAEAGGVQQRQAYFVAHVALAVNGNLLRTCARRRERAIVPRRRGAAAVWL